VTFGKGFLLRCCPLLVDGARAKLRSSDGRHPARHSWPLPYRKARVPERALRPCVRLAPGQGRAGAGQGRAGQGSLPIHRAHGKRLERWAKPSCSLRNHLAVSTHRYLVWYCLRSQDADSTLPMPAARCLLQTGIKLTARLRLARSPAPKPTAHCIAGRPLCDQCHSVHRVMFRGRRHTHTHTHTHTRLDMMSREAARQIRAPVSCKTSRGGEAAIALLAGVPSVSTDEALSR
jgi:hypothetical protein